MLLWEGVLALHPQPIILTGIPWSINEAAQNKRDWVKKHLGDVQVVTCFSKDKCKYGLRGDVLVDDRTKYSQGWLEMGGIFIHHKSAEQSLIELAPWFPPGANAPTP
jgi:hypothetical protein